MTRENHTPPIFYHSLACLYTQASYDNSKHFTSNFGSSIKNSCGELIVSSVTYNKNNFTHFFVHKHHKNSQKSSQEFKTTRIQYFLNQQSYLNISLTNRQRQLLVATS